METACIFADRLGHAQNVQPKSELGLIIQTLKKVYGNLCGTTCQAGLLIIQSFDKYSAGVAGWLGNNYSMTKLWVCE